MHLNVDARDRKSIPLFISTGCLRPERFIGRVSAAELRPESRSRDMCAAMRLPIFAVARGHRVTVLCARVIRSGCQQDERGAFRRGGEGLWDLGDMGSHMDPVTARWGRCARVLAARPESAFRQRRVRVSPQGANEELARWGVKNPLRYAVKMAPDSAPLFDDGFERSKWRFPHHPLRGPLPPAFLGGSVLQNYAQRQRNSERPSETLCVMPEDAH